MRAIRSPYEKRSDSRLPSPDYYTSALDKEKIQMWIHMHAQDNLIAVGGIGTILPLTARSLITHALKKGCSLGPPMKSTWF